MKRTYSPGFTLVEILVGINLGFIVITLIVSFYLIFNKFYIGFIRKIEVKQNLFTTVYQIENLLKKQNGYDIHPIGNGCKIICNSGKSILLKEDEIWINDLPAITDIVEFVISFKLKNGNALEFSFKKNSLEDPGQNYTTSINSNQIESYSLVLKKDTYLINLSSVVPKYNLNRFENNADIISK